MENYQYILIKDIHTNPYQPRKDFSIEKLNELANSIKENGLIQPIIVRKSSIIGYELLAGERRFRAAKIAGLTEIPALVKSLSDDEMMKQAIIENLQREDLNPIEEAESYQNIKGEKILYQKGKLSEILPVEKIISELENRVGDIEDSIIFSGTVPLISTFKYGDEFICKIYDKKNNSTLNLNYEINQISEEEK